MFVVRVFIWVFCGVKDEEIVGVIVGNLEF